MFQRKPITGFVRKLIQKGQQESSQSEKGSTHQKPSYHKPSYHKAAGASSDSRKPFERKPWSEHKPASSTHSRSTSTGGTGTRRPYSSSRPKFGEGREPARAEGSSSFGERPKYSHSKPAFSESRPRYGAGTASSTTSRPSFGGERGGFGGSRPRFGGSSSGSSFGGRSGGFGGGRGRSSGRGGSNNRGKSEYLNISRFINKVDQSAAAQEEQKYVPNHKFADFEIDDRLKNTIIGKGYEHPTPIQDQSIPHGLKGQDVIGIANTGTGKTAAFLIPLIQKVLKDRTQKVLILAPTRELAVQIRDEFVGFAKTLNLYSVSCIGGASIRTQIFDLRKPYNFIIGTPGRIMDLIERRAINLSNFHNVVLDEADRMVDMGFLPDVKHILGMMPKERQSFFFTATLSAQVEGLIHQFLTQPVKVSVKSRDTSANIDQDVVYVERDKKMEVLVDLLTKKEFDKVLIFGRTKHGVEKITMSLIKRGFRAESIHGDKTQSRRQKALTLFKKNQIQALVATDVAARGLDIPSVSHVINFDLPATYEDYVHRIGRTGRADKMGSALTFVEGRAPVKPAAAAPTHKPAIK